MGNVIAGKARIAMKCAENRFAIADFEVGLSGIQAKCSMIVGSKNYPPVAETALVASSEILSSGSSSVLWKHEVVCLLE